MAHTSLARSMPRQGGVCHPGWGGVDPGVCAWPSARCPAYSGFCTRGWLRQRDRREGAREWRASAAEVGGWHLAPAQTRGASTGAAPPQPLSQALPADAGAGDLLAEAARTDGLSDLPTAGLADWVWQRGKRPQARDASAPERARHALETRACQSHAGA